LHAKEKLTTETSIAKLKNFVARFTIPSCDMIHCAFTQLENSWREFNNNELLRQLQSGLKEPRCSRWPKKRGSVGSPFFSRS
jgi:hypothetical protein